MSLDLHKFGRLPTLAEAIAAHETLGLLKREEREVGLAAFTSLRILSVPGLLVRNARVSDDMKKKLFAEIFARVEEAYSSMVDEMATRCPADAKLLVSLPEQIGPLDLNEMMLNRSTDEHEMALIVDYRFL